MKVVCLGSLNIDHVYQVDHFVTAGETSAAIEMQDYCGGKGLNQSVALSRAGCTVYHAGMVGPDGEALLNMLRENGVDTSLVRTVKAPTGHAMIQVDKKGQNCILIYGGANVLIDEPFIDEIYSHFQKGDIVLLQNEVSCLPYAIRRAHELGLQIALNPSPMTGELLSCGELNHVTWFILNEIEGRMISEGSTGEEIIKGIREKYKNAAVMLTLGEDGCIYDDGTCAVRRGIFPVTVVDTTAAGDTFTGYFLAGVCEGLPVPDILTLASKASSMAVSAKGAAVSIPLRREVEKALEG